jgi:hypothetical protein
MQEPLDPNERLKRHVELMAECAARALKSKEAMEAGNRSTAGRYLKRAESYLKAAKDFEAS